MVTFAIGNMIIRTSEGHLIHPLPKDRIKQVSYSWQKLVCPVLKNLWAESRSVPWQKLKLQTVWCVMVVHSLL